MCSHGGEEVEKRITSLVGFGARPSYLESDAIPLRHSTSTWKYLKNVLERMSIRFFTEVFMQTTVHGPEHQLNLTFQLKMFVTHLFTS
jgi:hypothetical protein